MTEIRVLVTGAREVTPGEAAFVRRVLDGLFYAEAHRHTLVIVQGECPYGGVDLVAKQWAESMHGCRSEGHPADWDQFGKAAGPRRNSFMVSLGADLVLAFPSRDSRGTWDCLQKAVAAGIPPGLYPLHIMVH